MKASFFRQTYEGEDSHGEMQTTEKRSDDVKKTKFGLVGHIQNKKR